MDKIANTNVGWPFNRGTTSAFIDFWCLVKKKLNKRLFAVTSGC